MVFFGGARRHKIIRQSDEEFVFRCQYSGTDPFTTGGRESRKSTVIDWNYPSKFELQRRTRFSSESSQSGVSN
jgi:hypothetical protein